MAQLVERVLGKDEVLGSNPSGSFQGPKEEPDGVSLQSDSAVSPRLPEGAPGADQVDVWGGWAGSPPNAN